VISRVSTNARFRIECTGGVPNRLSRDLCVKGYFTDLGQMARDAGVPEAAFYRDLASATGVRTLRCVYVDIDPATHASVVVTEDVVAQGGSFLDPLSEYTPDQASQSLEELARLHAATWMRPAHAETPWLASRLHNVTRVRGIREIRGNFEGPIGAKVPDAVRDADRLFHSYLALASEAASTRPWSVIHGDTHVGNLFLDRDGRPSFVDWQLVQRGPWYLDVGYHIASTLAADDRRRFERELVGHYLDRLVAYGVEAPPEGDVWPGVRRGFVHGFYLWGITLKVDPAITAALLERLGTAVADHDAFDSIG
jgi:Phosphotransferase enzyme family